MTRTAAPQILAKRHLPVLTSLAMSNVLLAFDYDGTLAPIVANPNVARMRPKTRHLLMKLAQQYPCVVISGRTRRDLAGRLNGIPVRLLAGNHGLEPWGEEDRYVEQVHDWVRQLNPRLASCPGVEIEDKSYSVTIHYRRAHSKRRARRAILTAVAGLRGARVVGSKQAVNIIPQGAPDKGTALDLAWRALGCEAAIYVGDDDTDEDAFKVSGRDSLLSIRVGLAGRSWACYRLRNQQQIDELLERLLACRRTRRETSARDPRLATAR
jgi:trehalose 6-phosphate phosphatase